MNVAERMDYPIRIRQYAGQLDGILAEIADSPESSPGVRSALERCISINNSILEESDDYLSSRPKKVPTDS